MGPSTALFIGVRRIRRWSPFWVIFRIPLFVVAMLRIWAVWWVWVRILSLPTAVPAIKASLGVVMTSTTGGYHHLIVLSLWDQTFLRFVIDGGTLFESHCLLPQVRVIWIFTPAEISRRRSTVTVLQTFDLVDVGVALVVLESYLLLVVMVMWHVFWFPSFLEIIRFN